MYTTRKQIARVVLNNGFSKTCASLLDNPRVVFLLDVSAFRRCQIVGKQKNKKKLEHMLDIVPAWREEETALDIGHRTHTPVPRSEAFETRHDSSLFSV